MKSSLEYQYRVYKHYENLFGRGNSISISHYPFSLPPTGDGREFTIIERPEIPELDGFVEKYINNLDNNTKNYSDKKCKQLIRKLK